MSAVLEFISNNSLVSTLIATAVVVAIGSAWKWWHDRQNSQAIYNFLLSSRSATGFTFRSTEAISSHTKIPENRVAVLCSRHPKIRRNEKGKQSGTLVE